jgi:alkylation response protein AidB-like acyl-CoA dehydrogenase
MNVLGQVNGAWSHVRQSLDLERVAVAAECVGAARACVDLALSYARARVQFGRPIVDFQAIQHKIVDMTMDLETSRLITFHSARLLQDGGSGTFHAALAKYHSGQMYFRCAIDGMSILGGYGYTTAFAMERHLRDAALYRVVPGQEVLKNTMARMILRDGIHR